MLPATQNPKKLLEQVLDTIHLKHYSERTGETYTYWIRKYIHFHKAQQGIFRHPAEMGMPEIETFLIYLATEQNLPPAKTRPSVPCYFCLEMS